MLAVGREDVVLRAQRAAGADLRGLLAEQLGPDAELAVPLERGGLGVDAAGEDHVAVEAADGLGLLVGAHAVAEGELGVLDALALRGQELDELGAAVLLGGPEDLHQVGAESCVGHVLHSFVFSGAAGSPLAASGRRSDRTGGCSPAATAPVAGAPRRTAWTCDRGHIVRRRIYPWVPVAGPIRGAGLPVAVSAPRRGPRAPGGSRARPGTSRGRCRSARGRTGRAGRGCRRRRTASSAASVTVTCADSDGMPLVIVQACRSCTSTTPGTPARWSRTSSRSRPLRGDLEQHDRRVLQQVQRRAAGSSPRSPVRRSGRRAGSR